MSGLPLDMRYAFRSLWAAKSFSVTALMALAIGIGASAAIFTIVHAVLLRPLPFEDPSRIVVLLEKNLRSGHDFQPTSPANYADLKKVRSLRSIAAAEMWGATLGGAGNPERLSGLRMSADMLGLLRVQPQLGGGFSAEEEQPGRNRVLLLSDSLWKRRFGGDPNVVGTTVPVNGEPFRIVGVMPSSFRFPPFWAAKAEMWTPLSFTPVQAASRVAKSLRVFGRLRAEATLTQAAAELSSIAEPMRAADVRANVDMGISITPLAEMVTGKVRQPLLFLALTVGLVLLLACANVATLQLSRSVARRREIEIRLSLGATKFRIIRQLFTEALLLASFGGILGILLAQFGLESIAVWLQHSLPRHEDIHLDAAALLLSLVIVFAAAVLFGLMPAVQLDASQLTSASRGGSRVLFGNRWTSRLRGSLVIAQVAIALVLLLSAGLIGRSFLRIQAINPGFQSHGILTATLNTSGTSAAPPERQIMFYEQAIAAVAALPGVSEAAAINHLPIAGDSWGTEVMPEERTYVSGGEVLRATYRLASPGYFHTMAVPLIRGREFTGADTGSASAVAVVNAGLAQQLWPAQDPIGKRLRLGSSPQLLTVVGVCVPVRQQEWLHDPEPEIYLNYIQQASQFGNGWSSSMSLVVRSANSRPEPLALAVVQAVHRIEPAVPVSGIETMDEIVNVATEQPRMYATLLGIFAVGALLLACIGLYGVVSYWITQRTQELGVRHALGATAPMLVRLVLRQALSLVLAGGVVGGLLASFILPAANSLLYRVGSGDVSNLIGVFLLLLAASATAAYVPARRAAALDPVVALRSE